MAFCTKGLQRVKICWINLVCFGIISLTARWKLWLSSRTRLLMSWCRSDSNGLFVCLWRILEQSSGIRKQIWNGKTVLVPGAEFEALDSVWLERSLSLGLRCIIASYKMYFAQGEENRKPAAVFLCFIWDSRPLNSLRITASFDNIAPALGIYRWGQYHQEVKLPANRPSVKSPPDCLWKVIAFGLFVPCMCFCDVKTCCNKRAFKLFYGGENDTFLKIARLRMSKAKTFVKKSWTMMLVGISYSLEQIPDSAFLCLMRKHFLEAVKLWCAICWTKWPSLWGPLVP